MKKQKQLELFKKDLRFFGGALLEGKRKSRRVLSTKEPIHIVMRSLWAKGENSFLHRRNKKPIENLIQKTAKAYLVRVYRVALVGNHIHLLVLARNRTQYKSFIRVLSSQIASQVMRNLSFKSFKQSLRGDGGKQALKQGKEQQFWQYRPFSRVLFWGRDFKNCCKYLVQNTLEALGFIEYQARRGHSYERFLTSG